MRTWAVTLVGVLILGVVGCSTTPVPTRDPRLVAPPLAPPPMQAAPQTPPLLGRWYGAGSSTLDIRGSGDGLRWIWNSPETWGFRRAAGTGSVTGDQVSLMGSGPAPGCGGPPQYAFTLEWDGTTLRGTMKEPCNAPVAVEFTRSQPLFRSL